MMLQRKVWYLVSRSASVAFALPLLVGDAENPLVWISSTGFDEDADFGVGATTGVAAVADVDADADSGWESADGT